MNMILKLTEEGESRSVS